MRIKKVVTNGGEVRWEVYGFLLGRGSKQLRKRFSKKVEAEEFLESHRSQLKEMKRGNGALQTFEESTFEGESNYWLERQGIRFSPGHLRRVKGVLKQLLPEIGKLPLNQLHPMRLSAYQSRRLAEGKKPATVNRETDVITAVINFSVRHRRVPFNPAAGFRKLAEIREDMNFWERDQAVAFLNFADAKYPKGSEKRWIYVVYLLALNTALRAGEIWGLRPKDIVQEGQLLHIQRQFDLNVRDFRPPKGKKSRYVPCNQFLHQELMELIGQKGAPAEQTVFRSEAGTPIDHDNFVDRFLRDAQEAGLKRIRFHDLRHTGTTLMIADGLDLKTVKEICGHKDISTTMKYVHLLGDSIKNAAKSFAIVPVAVPRLQLVSNA